MNLVMTGLIVILVAWVIQLVRVTTSKKKTIGMEFAIIYAIGAILMAVSYVEGALELAVLNGVIAALALIVWKQS